MSKIEQHVSGLEWAQAQIGGDCAVIRLPQAASKRVYYRLQQAKCSWVLMDATAEVGSARQSASLTDFFSGLGVRVPRVVAAQLNCGWLLIEDLGSDRLLERLCLQPQSVGDWYQAAWRILLRLQTAATKKVELLSMDFSFARRESMRFMTDFVPTRPSTDGDLPAMERAIAELAALVAAQPQGLSHRDFHAANLMCLADGELGVLDFQAAFYAPLVYDAVSLLRDCYIDWPPAQVMDWLHQFYLSSPLWQEHYTSFAELKEDFNLVSLQRHLKCAGLFVALVQSGQTEYQAAIPRTLSYLRAVCEQDTRWGCFLKALTE